jgi:p-methyltransferase
MNERGILSLASMIVGFPGETSESVNNSIEFLNDAQPTFYNVQVYYHDKQAPIEKRRDELSITGSGYSWSHATMDWRTAVLEKERMLRLVDGPLQLPLYGFSIWTVPYLMKNGLSVDMVKNFTRLANRLSRAAMDESQVDVDVAIGELINQPGWCLPAGQRLLEGADAG